MKSNFGKVVLKRFLFSLPKRQYLTSVSQFTVLNFILIQMLSEKEAKIGTLDSLNGSNATTMDLDRY